MKTTVIDPDDIADYPFDEVLIAATWADGESRLEAYRIPATMVVLGRGSDPEQELHQERCREDGVSIYRRRGGGCAVVLDRGTVIVSASVDFAVPPGITAAFQCFSRWIINTLKQLGYPGITQAGSSDLVLGDRKIGGACLYLSRGLHYYSASLLIAPQIDLMERLLPHPPREPAYRRKRAHRDFVGALLPGASESDIQQFEDRLRNHLRFVFPYPPSRIV